MMVSYKPTQGASISIPLTGFGTDLRNSIGVQTVKDDGFIINVGHHLHVSRTTSSGPAIPRAPVA